MAEIEVKFATRYIKRKRSNAIGKSLLKTLTEPITNSDDSYRRLNSDDAEGSTIDIYIDRKKRLVRIIDHAEGMSFEQLKEKFEYYGSDKSGASQGKDVRGLFGQGVSDVLFYHSEGLMRTVKDGQASLCYFYEKNGKPFIKIEKIQIALEKISKEWGINTNHGTVVEFVLDDNTTIHEYENLAEKIGSFYMLRFITSNDSRKVRLIYNDGKSQKQSKIHYAFPKGDLVQRKEFAMKFENYAPVKIEAEIYRSNDPLITMGEERQSGLLVYDDRKTVYDLTFFGLDGLPTTDKFYGFVKLTGAREIVLDKINHEKHPEEILTDSRDGFNKQYEFYKQLEQIMRDWLYPILSDERRKRADDGLSETVKENHQKAFEELNRLYSEFAGDESGGTILTKNPTRPPGGIAFARNHIQITSGKKYSMQLIIDTKIIKPDSVVKITSSNHKVAFTPDDIIIEKSEREDELLIKTVGLRGNQADTADTITASFGKRTASVVVSVVREEIVYPKNGIVFSPDYIDAVVDRDTSLNLYVDLKVIKMGSKIRISSSNKNIQLQETVVIPKSGLRSNKSIARVPVVFRGNGVGESGTIEAVFKDFLANARVNIHDKRNTSSKNHTGKFKDWDFDENLVAPYQSIFDSNPESPTHGYILINPNHPINKKYFGENPTKADVEKAVQSRLYLAEVVLNESLNIIIPEALKNGGLPRRLGDDNDVLFYIAEKKYQHGNPIYSLFTGEQLSHFEAKMKKEAREMLPVGVPDDISDREKQMVELRFGLNEQRPHTLDEIARKFDITRERVRQILQKVLGKKYAEEGEYLTEEKGKKEIDYIQEEARRISGIQEKIIYCTATFYGLTKNQMMAKTRQANIAFARQVSIYLLRNMIGLSFPSIGGIFSLDHTTTLYASDKIGSMLETDEKLREQIEQIKGLILPKESTVAETQSESIK
jgi:AraC-like DNA-binding protein